MSSIKWKRTSSFGMSTSTISWSNVDYSLTDFVKKTPPPQVVKVKKEGGKSSAFKNSTELVLHESRALKKVEACVVSEGKTFVLPYDCPAKVYQLTRAEEYTSLGELRKALPTCRFFLITSKPQDQQLKDIGRGEVLTIVFKKTISGSDVFTCERKKLGVKVEIKGNAQGGFAPMGTMQERKISDFVRHYSTFPVGIGLTESTLANKAFASLNELITHSKSGLIRLTRLFNVDAVIASSLAKKKIVYAIPKSFDLTVTASKALLLEDSEHTDYCRKLHEEVDKASIDKHLSLVVSSGATGSEVLQWCYGNESHYEETVASLKTGKANGEVSKRDAGGGLKKEQARKITSIDGKSDPKSKESKEKIKEKDRDSKETSKENDKEKSKDKQKDKKAKEAKAEKIKEEKAEKTKEAKLEKSKEVKTDKIKEGKAEKPKETKTEKSKFEKAKFKERPTIEKIDEPEEDDAGYLVPAEVLRAQRENAQENGGECKERSSIGISLGRFMDKVKGKKDGKKLDRPASGIDVAAQKEDEVPRRKSATMPAGSNIKKPGLSKNKAKTMSADELNVAASTDDLDGPASPKEQEEKKRDKSKFSTAGKKAGAILRKKLSKSKGIDEHNDAPKQTSPNSSQPSSPHDDHVDSQDMYVTPVDNQVESSCPTTSIWNRELPELPPEELRKPSTIEIPEIPYDDDGLYDEINPIATKTFKIPKDLSKLSTNDISEVLRSLNMSEHVPKFRNEQIDGEIFKSLNDNTLGSLGVADPVQRLKIKKLLKGWRPKN